MQSNSKNAQDEEAKLMNEAYIQEDAECGWRWLRLPCLRSWRTGGCALLALCCASALQGLVVNGLVDVNLTTIERRFGLRSSHTGLIAGAYDIAALLCLIPITYLGGRPGVSKPRWLGVGLVIMAVGSVVFVAPHFLSDVYRANADLVAICARRPRALFYPLPKTHVAVNATSPEDERLTGMRWYFYTGQFLHGVGTVPLYTLGVTYLDDNVTNKMSALYLGIFYSQTIFGTALGYLLGGQTLSIFTNAASSSATDLGLTRSSQAWVGAWWLGFIVAAVFTLALAACIAALPPILPGAPHGPHKTPPGSDGALRTLPGTTLRLLRNPTFCFLNLAGAAEGFTAAGFCAFLPKYLESQFSVGSTKASLIMGLIAVPAGAGGTCLGGYLVQRWELRCTGMLKLCLSCTLIGTLFTTAFLLACPDPPFPGVTSSYGNCPSSPSSSTTLSDLYTGDYTLPANISELLGEYHLSTETTTGSLYTGDFTLPENEDLLSFASSTASTHPASNVSLNNVCNAGCACSMDLYDPVCGTDQRQYFSPCYAGCSITVEAVTGRMYSNCSCVGAVPNVATPAKCASTCHFLAPFIVLIFGLMFFTFICAMPALAASLRCVLREQRSLAVGVQWLVVRLLGTIPAPVLFGALIDHACLLWHGSGSCLVFDNFRLSKYLMVLAVGGKLLGLAWFYMAWRCYLPPAPEGDDEGGMLMEAGTESYGTSK